MKKVFGNVLYPIFATSITLIFTGVLFFRAKHKDISFNQLRFLIMFSLLIVLLNFLQAFDWDIAADNPPFARPLGHPILNIVDLCLCLATLTLYFHFESLISYYPHLIRFIVVTVTVFPLTLLNIIIIFYQKEWINETIGLLSTVMALGVLFIVIFMIWTVSRIYNIHANKRTRGTAILMAASILNLGFAFASQQLTSDYIDFIVFTANIYQLMLFSISVSILGIGYIIDPYLIYSNPFELQALIIYDDAGILVYHINYSLTDSNQDSAITSSALSAINMLMKEISGFREIYQGFPWQMGNLYLLIVRNLQFVLYATKYPIRCKPHSIGLLKD